MSSVPSSQTESFNISPLNTYFSKIFGKYVITENYEPKETSWIWTVKIDGKSAKPTYDCFPDELCSFSSPPSRSKEEAKGSVTVRIFEMASLDIERFKKIFHDGESLDPLEKLNNLVQQFKGDINWNMSRSPYSKHYAILRVQDKTYESFYDYYKDTRYCKKKMAMELLEAWSFNSEPVSTFFEKLRKDRILYKGRIFSVENSETEFKGGKDPLSPVNENSVFAKSTDIGKTVCAFLNTNGGSIFFGIHDKHSVIQGVKFDSRQDDVMFRLNQSLKHRLDGVHSEGYMKILFHEVLQFPIDSERVPPSPPLQMDSYHHYLREELESLRDHLRKINTGGKERLFVIEINVKKHPSLVLFEGKGYCRSENSNSAMTLDQLKARILEENNQK